jgi:nitrogen-specific signal transduction histidine kinase
MPPPGPGMFEPFFTTKGDKGTGLGLAVTDQIMTRAGGFLEVESEPGRGTTMRVLLPRIGPPPPPAAKGLTRSRCGRTSLTAA